MVLSSAAQQEVENVSANVKKGKKYCPDSKGIPEQAIEEAFLESYRLLCDDNKDILKTGLKNNVDGSRFRPKRKNARDKHRTAELCSNDKNEV